MQYGNLYATRGVADQMEKDKEFEQEVLKALRRYTRYDWGDLCVSDKALNDAAAAGADRVLAAYSTSAGVIWIITEWDRSATTILFFSERVLIHGHSFAYGRERIMPSQNMY